MKSWPRWVVWASASAVLWAMWVTFAYMPLRQKQQQESSSEMEWSIKERDMLSRIQSTPQMLTQLDDFGNRIDSTTSTFPQSSSVTSYMDELADLGRLSGIRSVEVNPALSSMMALTKINSARESMLDTLVVEFTAVGGFQEIGSWLDQVESQASFRNWALGQWDKGPEPGTIRFTGSAAFLVAVPKGATS